MRTKSKTIAEPIGDCGDRLIDLNEWFFESIRRWDLIGVGVILLDEMCHCWWVCVCGEAFILQSLKPGPVPLLLPPADPDVEFLPTSPTPCLPDCCYTHHYDENGLKL